MHTRRLSSWLSLLLLAGILLAIGALGGCRHRPLPERSSPVLEPTGASTVLDGLQKLDQRRDGVFAVRTSGAVIVQRMTDSGVIELFRAASIEGLVSRADDDVLVSMDLSVEPYVDERVAHWNGVELVDLTPRLEGALILTRPFVGAAIEAIDLAADGSVVVSARVGQSRVREGDAPYGQLCTLRPSGDDACEPLEPVTGYATASADAVLVERTRTYLVISEGLYVREDGGAFSLVADQVRSLRSIEGGRVGYVRNERGLSVLYVLGPEGREERRVEGVGSPTGHAAAGLWLPRLHVETDGSCEDVPWSCHEETVWTQLTVWHVGEALREVAHLDNVTRNGFLEPRALGLTDGSVRLEIGGEVYEVRAP